MEPHQVYQTAVKRGDARRVGREMGYTSGEIPRRWMRPAASPTNLFTGELSPVMKAKAELLAHDRVNPDATNILLFDLFVADVARQRERIIGDNEDAVLAALINSYHTAIESLFTKSSPQLTEQELYRCGGAIVRALLFVIGDDGQGVPLMRIDSAAAPRGERVGVGARLLALLGRKRG